MRRIITWVLKNNRKVCHEFCLDLKAHFGSLWDGGLGLQACYLSYTKYEISMTYYLDLHDAICFYYLCSFFLPSKVVNAL